MTVMDALTGTRQPPSDVTRLLRKHYVAGLLGVLFALLLVSTPIQHISNWQHMAQGRSMLAGTFSFGSHASATSVYDLLIYLTYLFFNGPGLIALKVLAVVLLVMILFKSSGWDSHPHLALFYSMLSLLVASYQLQLQPLLFSLLFFATCFYLEERQAVLIQNGITRERLAFLWPYALLFIAWSNIDSWFIVGLAYIYLSRLGRRMDRWLLKQHSVKTGELRVPNPARNDLYLLIGLPLLCLINPATIDAFNNPLGAGPAPVFNHSPFFYDYAVAIGTTVAGGAFYLLVSLIVLIFILNQFASLRWSWLLPLSILCVASFFNASFVPFCALLAGPILARETSTIAERSLARRRIALTLGRSLTYVSAVLLCIVAWPGWLHLPPYGMRNWRVAPPPSLEVGPRRLQQWLSAGSLLSNPQALYWSQEAAAACDWYCPAEKGMYDQKLTQAILDNKPDWKKQLQDHHFNHLVLYEKNRDKLLQALAVLVAEEDDWPLVFVAGNFAVFAHDESVRKPFAYWNCARDLLEPDAHGHAFFAGPPHELESPFWWDAFVTVNPSRTLELDSAAMSLLLADAYAFNSQRKREHFSTLFPACEMVLLGSDSSLPKAFLSLVTRYNWIHKRQDSVRPEKESALLDPFISIQHNLLMHTQDETPYPLILKAIRNARRAIIQQPENAESYLILGECYTRLARSTRERAWKMVVPELAEIRQVQALVALHHVLLLEPESVRAHFVLAGLYKEMHYFDLELKHREIFAAIVRNSSPPPGVSSKQYRDQLIELNAEISTLKRIVETQTSAWETETKKSRVYERAQSAMKRGLAGKALAILMESGFSAFGNPGMALELTLFLLTDRFRNVLEWLQPDFASNLGQDYFRLKAKAWLAYGNYEGALQELANLALTDGPTNDIQNLDNRARSITDAVLDFQPVNSNLVKFLLAGQHFGDALYRVDLLSLTVRRRADFSFISALVALEAGEIDLCRKSLRQALNIWNVDDPLAATGSIDFRSRKIAQSLWIWIVANRHNE